MKWGAFWRSCSLHPASAIAERRRNQKPSVAIYNPLLLWTTSAILCRCYSVMEIWYILALLGKDNPDSYISASKDHIAIEGHTRNWVEHRHAKLMEQSIWNLDAGCLAVPLTFLWTFTEVITAPLHFHHWHNLFNKSVEKLRCIWNDTNLMQSKFLFTCASFTTSFASIFGFR